MLYSVSSVKTFCGSKAKRAGQYLLGIRDDFESDALLLGKLFENYLITGKDSIEDIVGDSKVLDMEKLMEDYENLKYNSKGLKFEIGSTNYKVEGELLGQKFIGYIDNITTDWIDDIKTSRYLTKEDSNSINMWSGMTTYEEYELQLRVYMKLANRSKARIIEIAKHKYKDERNEHQILEFELTDEFDKKMTNKFGPIIKEMSELYNKHNFLEDN